MNYLQLREERDNSIKQINEIFYEKIRILRRNCNHVKISRWMISEILISGNKEVRICLDCHMIMQERKIK